MAAERDSPLSGLERGVGMPYARHGGLHCYEPIIGVVAELVLVHQAASIQYAMHLRRMLGRGFELGSGRRHTLQPRRVEDRDQTTLIDAGGMPNSIYKPATSSATISAAGCGCLASATL